MSLEFETCRLGPGVNLHILPTEKFKTVTTYVYLHNPLTEATVTANALLPMVLARGTAGFPTTPALVRRLDDLFGAGLGFDVIRRGEVQSLTFKLELPDQSYLYGAEGLLAAGLDTLAEVILHPAVHNGGFNRDYVTQEKANLAEMINSLINNKIRYSLHRCRAEMCAGEPYALHPQGRIEDLASISAHSLREHWEAVLRQARIDILLIGNAKIEQVAEVVGSRFNFPTGSTRHLPATRVQRQARARGHLEERMPVGQGVLVIGFRTGITAADPDYFDLVVANGILGGFSHSKLFENVREKHSLAYSAYSLIEAIKGVGFMYAGIDFDKYDQALAIIEDQLAQLQQGNITTDEITATKRALVNGAQVTQDRPGRLADDFISGLLAGRPLTVEERVAGYQAVTPEAVAVAAAKFQPELVYFLNRTADSEGKGDNFGS